MRANDWLIISFHNIFCLLYSKMKYFLFRIETNIILFIYNKIDLFSIRKVMFEIYKKLTI